MSYMVFYCTSYCNVTSDWITLKNCDSISAIYCRKLDVITLRHFSLAIVDMRSLQLFTVDATNYISVGFLKEN